MGRIIFLTTVAFLAYRYISKSNQRHQSLPAGEKNGAVEVLPPTTAGTASLSSPAVTPSAATEPVARPKLIGATTSRAAESDPVR